MNTVINILKSWLVNLPARYVHAIQNNLQSLPSNTYLGDHRILLNTKRNHLLIVDSRDLSLTPQLIHTRTWEESSTRAIETIVQKGMIVVDIGANIGHYSVILGTIVGENGKVHAFEANHEVVKLLRDNCDINGLLHTNTIVNNFAVIDSPQELSLHVLEKHLGSSSIMNFDPAFIERNKETFRKVSVLGVSLDSYFKKGSHVDLVRIDAEGSELLILKGMKRVISENPHIVIVAECNKPLLEANGQTVENFINAFLQEKFRPYLINSDGSLTLYDNKYFDKHQTTDLVFKRTEW